MTELDPREVEAAAVRMLATLVHAQRNRLSGLSLESTDLREQAAAEGAHIDTARLDDQVREWGEELRALREKAEPSDPQLVVQPVGGVLEAWLQAVHDRWAEMGVTFSWDIQGCAEEVVALDAKQITAALDALADNAAEAVLAAGGGDVTVRGEITEGGVAVTLANAVAERPELMRRWGRMLGFTTKRRHLGLGCRFARLVAEAHGGSCGWVFQAEGGLVVAAVWLPLGE